MEGQYGYVPHHGGGYYADDHSPISPGAYGNQMYQQQMNHPSGENLHQYLEYDTITLNSPADAPKTKRRQSHGLDHVKHKRTRSGCFTCRTRRVKCDEAHPICERCRKGQRECVYPDQVNQRPPRDLSKYKTAQGDSPSSSEEVETAEKQKLPAIADEGDDIGSGRISEIASSAKAGVAHDSMSPPNNELKPVSPIDASHKSISKRPAVSRLASRQQQTKTVTLANPKWAALPKDIRFYIKYYRENITCHHYALKYDNNNFLKTTFLEIALSYEPLLYAITAFSAYFHTLTRPDAKIQDFLSYYNKSVSLLRESLSKSTRHSTATLLAILQLAMFEEYLGDWVNLFNHQKAACEIIVQLFTPETIVQNETRRKIIHWYMRFDILTGIVSGYETMLGREWHAAAANFYVNQAADKPDDIESRMEEAFAKNALLAFDFAVIFGKKAKNAISDEDFVASIADIRKQIAERDTALETAFADIRTYVQDFPGAPKEEGWVDLFGTTQPNYLLAGPLWSWNIALLDWWGIKLMFLGQLHQIDRSVDPMILGELGFKICRSFEGFEFAGSNKPVDVLAMHASLGVAMTMVPRTDAHKEWCRSKLALIESCGYIHPAQFRYRLSEVWGMDPTDPWWQEKPADYPPILHAIREFIEYRTLHPNDAQGDLLRDLRTVFNAMNLEDDPHKNSGVGSSDIRSTGSVTTDESGPPTGTFDPWVCGDSSPELNWDAPVGSDQILQREWK